MDRLFLLLFLCIAPDIANTIDIAVNVSETAKARTEVWNTTEYQNCSLNGGPNTEKYFWMDFYDTTIALVLEKPLDLEVLVQDNVFNNTNTVLAVQLQCERSNSNKENITVLVHVVPQNEFHPVFLQAPYDIEIKEGIPMGSTIFTLKDKMQDKDAFKFNNVVSYEAHPYLISALDGRSFFSVGKETGVVTTDAKIDYELFERHNYVLNITATDDGGLVSFPTTLSINITDIDDMPPQFYDPQNTGCRINCSTLIYRRIIDIHFQGDLEDVMPYRVVARDGDRGINAKINYTVEYDTTDELESNIVIDDVSGVLQIVAPYDNFTNVTSGNMEDPFFVTVTIVATENGTNRRSANASFTLTVYRVIPTPPPPTTPTTTSIVTTDIVTTDIHEHKRDDDDDGDGSSPLLLIEILVPCCLSVVILVTIIIVFLLKRQKRKEMKYQVKEKEKETRRQSDMMDSLPATMASPYDLVGAYAHFDLGTYDKKGAGGASDIPAEQNIPQDDYNGILANSFDGLYTKIKKKIPRQAKMRAVDIVEADYEVGEDEHKYDGLEQEANKAPETEQTVEEVETDKKLDEEEEHGSYNLDGTENNTGEVETNAFGGDFEAHGINDLSGAGNNSGDVEANTFGGEGGQFGSYNVAEFGGEVGYFGNPMRNKDDSDVVDNEWPEVDNITNSDKQFNDNY